MDLQNLLNFVVYNYVLDQVCYPPYGCFNKSPPFDKPYLPLPSDPAKLDTSFTLYNRENNGVAVDNHTISKITKKKTILIAHGFLESKDAKWMHNIKNAILKTEDANVVIVNWKKAAAIPYTQAVSNIRIASMETAFFLRGLFDRKVTTPSNVHLIGFSLGAHMMGHVGKFFKEEKIHRITGLDPAGPFFQDTPASFRLDASDATYVDAIHSDGKPLLGYSTGFLEAIGHVDFYPNGGFTQPGCKAFKLEIPSKKDIYDHVTCNHYRAVNYFLESIDKANKFFAYSCESFDDFLDGKCDSGSRKLMGYHDNRKKNGKYFLVTNSRSPFPVHHYLMEMQTGNIEFADSVGSLKIQIVGENAKTNIKDEKLTYLELNETERHILHAPRNLGGKLKMIIKHGAGIYFADSWFLEKVFVIHLRSNKRYCNNDGRWLNAEEISIPLSTALCA